jgi:electron transfer flavoprotein alpha/beta subunit
VNIVVCLHAPPPDPDGTGLGRYDTHALAQALALGEASQGEVTAVLAGTSHESGPLQRALIAGAARAVRLGGEDYANVDFHTLGQALASGIKRIGADIVLAGARSDDEGLGAVPAAAARNLGFAYIAGVEELSLAGPRAVEIVVRGGGRKRRLRLDLPAVLSIVPATRGLPPPSERTGNPSEVELMTLNDPETTVVRRRTELLGKPEPASRGAEEVTSAAALVAALTRR